MKKTLLPKNIDFLIVGAGVTGLFLFKGLKEQCQSVVLIEKEGSLGGSLLRPNLEPPNLNSLAWTLGSSFPGLKYIENEAVAGPPVSSIYTLGKKGLIPFVGFGEEKLNPMVLDLLAGFLSDEVQIVSSLDSSYFEGLISSHSELIFTNTQVTDLRLELDGTFKAPQQIELNGKHRLNVHRRVIWTPSMQELAPLLTTSNFDALKQKIKKSKALDALSIQFELAPEDLGEHRWSKFIFAGEENSYWAGSLQGSYLTFTAFFSSTLTEDHSFLRKHVKSLKRTLHKAFPALFPEEILKDLSGTRVTLHKDIANSLKLSLSDDQGLKELPCLSFVGSHKSSNPQILDSKFNCINEMIQVFKPIEEVHL